MTQPLDPKAAPDLTPLAWVHEELRRTLEGVHKALRRALREYELRLASGQLDKAQTAAALATQVAQMHQAAGALRLVNLREGEQLLGANEALLLRMSAAGTLNQAQVDAIEKADFALLTYITRLLASGNPSPLILFPVYRGVQEQNQAERIHPADFWPQRFEWKALPPVILDQEVPNLDSLRDAFESALLRQMRQPNPAHALQLADLCVGLAACMPREPVSSFWQLAAAHFEAQATGLIETDAFIKRLGSRLLAQLRSHAQGHDDVADRLVQDLLFFCAQSRDPASGQAPRLRMVRSAYGLQSIDAGDYKDESLGRVDPSWISQAQRRVQMAKDGWSAASEGETARSGGMDEAFAALTESLTQLFPSGELLGQTLQRAAVVTLRAGQRPPAALGMEVATALLYVDAALEDAVFDHPDQATRVKRLAERVQLAATGSPSDALEPWMEELYRRVADRQTMGGVMHELRHNLNEVERLVDEYFRDPVNHREQLIGVPTQLNAMRGVLGVLGLPQAATTCLRMRDEVERLSHADVDPSQPSARQSFDRLATNLGQLGFLIDMLAVQPHVAKAMFQFDEAKGELVANVVRERRALPVAEPLVDQVRAAVNAADPGTKARDLERLALQAAADDQPTLAAVTQSAVRQMDAPALDISKLDLPSLDLDDSDEDSGNKAVSATDALNAFLDSQIPVDIPPMASPPVPAVPVAAPPSDEAIDEEMLEIFLEEANEVVETARASLAVLAEEPANKGEMTTVRRAFHTLKGSSRMVGLGTYGEAAWAVEQLYNTRLADEKPADKKLLSFSNEALDELAAWRDDIAAGKAGHRTPQRLRERADALRLGIAASVAAPVPAPAPVQAPAVQAQPPAVVAAVAPAVEAELPHVDEVETQSFANTQIPDFEHTQPAQDWLDSLSAEIAPEPAPAPVAATPTPPAPSADEDVTLDLDFDDSQIGLPVAQAPTALPELAPEGFELDLTLPEAPEPAPAEALPDLTLALDMPTEPAALAAETVDSVDMALDLPEPVEVPAAVPEPVEEFASLDDEVKEIGHLRISTALFNIFIGEADQHARRLAAELHDWAQVRDEAPPQSTEVYAHALAGNAATVGFEDLSALARALEHTLGRAQQAGRVAAQDAQLFTQCADEIAQLLHQFAAGFLKAPQPGLIERLQAYEPELPTPDVESQMGDLGAPEPAQAPEPLSHMVALADDSDYLGGQPDEIDPELWDIFEEEASDLLHQLLSRLRDWTQHAQDPARGDACMRTLHTFKGGARLAGAMRLGELAHLLESEVAGLMAAPSRTAGDLLPLQHRGDDLETEFERLRQSLRDGVKATPAPISAPVAPPAVREAEPTAVDLASFALPPKAAEPAPAVAAVLQPPVAAEPIEVPATDTTALPVSHVRAPVELPAEVPALVLMPDAIDWQRFSGTDARELAAADAAPLVSAQAMVRVRASLLDRMAAQAGEVSIRRARMESELVQMKSALVELDDNLERLRTQLRELEVQAEAQISSRQEAAKASGNDFDPLEFDRFTRFQEVTRMLAESVNDVATVQRSLQRSVSQGEDELAAQSRLTRELQDDLLRSRMVEFDSLAERLHRVVRQASRESGKQVQLELAGGGIELDRGVLERLIGAFEHLLRNSVVHGIEAPEVRQKAGKPAIGNVRIRLAQEGNQVLIAFSDDGAGLNLASIREKAKRLSLFPAAHEPTEAELVQLIYSPGFSTASQVSELAGRGVGMDVVRSEVNTLGGYVLTRTQAGKGTEFDLRVPLTTALTQVVLLRCGELQVAVPASLVDTVLRMPNHQLESAYRQGQMKAGNIDVPIYWLGGLMAHTDHPQLHGKHAAVVLVHSGPDRIAIHVDEVIGNQEVVVKNLGPQLMHVPGLAGISLLASGAVALIYNPVALAERYGAKALERAKAGGAAVIAEPEAVEVLAPLILVVDDSLTVRRVSQRFLEREGFRVMLAKDGLDALEQLGREDLPDMILSDIEMPRMDGFDLVRNIRSDERLRSLPVVMITSRIAEKHREYAQALGVQGYLGKPYDEELLLRLIREHTRSQVVA